MMESSPQTMMWNSGQRSHRLALSGSSSVSSDHAAHTLTPVERLIQVLDLFKVAACFVLGSLKKKKINMFNKM